MLDRFREKVGVKVVKALQRNDDGVTHAALDMLCALMQPMHDNPDLKQEQLNKASLLASAKFQEKLLETWVYHVVCVKAVFFLFFASQCHMEKVVIMICGFQSYSHFISC